MEWLHVHACPLGPKATIKATAGAQLKALEWLVEHGALFDAKTKRNARLALQNRLAMAKEQSSHDGAFIRRGTTVLLNGKSLGYWG